MVDDGTSEQDPTSTHETIMAKNLAKLLQDELNLRKNYFNNNIINGHGWDVLLELLIISDEQRSASVTVLSTLGDMKAATGLRWIEVLKNEGLVVVANDDDTRKKSIALSNQGRKDMERYLKSIAKLRELKSAD